MAAKLLLCCDHRRLEAQLAHQKEAHQEEAQEEAHQEEAHQEEEAAAHDPVDAVETAAFLALPFLGSGEDEAWGW